jgi:hypothetical protein
LSKAGFSSRFFTVWVVGDLGFFWADDDFGGPFPQV